ncbi:RNA-guided endonuclease TnpB family protein [Planomonospora sp. ID82291]|uniref:RNA-guided endonuclease InsQ/TnpB family protein n=1 Tax=Planomonospora sp. ID82291 TaxID=2738136 RepID=UPI0018C352E7|nr:RNA-guided endonuclease TnpB family protein [Planomonospora sp. ID82291]MBG0816038.1 IS200/IS605 family element transposase accessory protein TnpB [Planomonospora sp. ID82291]
MSDRQGFRIELDPTPAQRARLGRHAGLSRVVENFCLEKVRAALDQREAEKTYGVDEKDLTPVPWSAPALERAWRAEHWRCFPWFTADGLSSRIPKEACRVRAAAFKNFFDSRAGRRKGRKVGFPAWRKRKHGSRFRYDADRARPAGQRAVKLPGIGTVRTREAMTWLTDRLDDERARVIGATIREIAGRWWISFQVEIDRTDVNARRTVAADAPACGIDVGVKTFATIVDDDGTVTEIHAPKPLKNALRKLRRANKALARTQKGSKNRAKAARRVGRIHLDVAHQRADFLHKTTTMLARSKQAIAVETLNVAGMVTNRRLSRAISDLGFGEFFRQLAYKTDWYGSTVWAAGRWFPSSKLCGGCGAVNAGLTLADRVWTCECGTVHDRDVNAARNLLVAMALEQQAA